MSIIFRCPCGRSMVAESDRSGAVVTCPNCKRSLKVPTGKDRGMEIAPTPMAAKTRTSRRCRQCGKDVPVDSQACPHCGAPLTEAAAAVAAPVAAPLVAKPVAAKPVTVAKAVGPAAELRAATAAGGTVVYGGARKSWWSRQSAGAKAGVVGGIVVGAGLLALAAYLIGSSYAESQLTQARADAQKNLREGKKFENSGKFQEAYDLYSFTEMKRRLNESLVPTDKDLAAALEARFAAFRYLAADAGRKSVYWKPANQQEFDQAMAQFQQSFPTYKQLVLAIADAGLDAAKAGMTDPSQAAYDEKVGKVMDLYVKFVAQTTDPQRAKYSFQTLLESLKSLGAANRHWASADMKKTDLFNSKGYLEGLKERVASPDADPLWER